MSEEELHNYQLRILEKYRLHFVRWQIKYWINTEYSNFLFLNKILNETQICSFSFLKSSTGWNPKMDISVLKLATCLVGKSCNDNRSMHLPCFWLWDAFVERFKRIIWYQKYEHNKIIFSDQVDDPKTGFSRSCVKSLHLPKSENLIEDHFKTKLRSHNIAKRPCYECPQYFSIQNIKNSEKLFVKFNRQQFIGKSFIPNGGESVLFPYIWTFLSFSERNICLLEGFYF